MYNFSQQMGLKLREGEHLKLLEIPLIKKPTDSADSEKREQPQYVFLHISFSVEELWPESTVSTAKLKSLLHNVCLI